MRSLAWLVMVGALFAPLANRAGAQTASPLRLTVDEAVARGLATSHRIAEAMARQSGAEAVVGERRAEGRPQVAAQAGYTRTNHVDPFGVVMPTNQFEVIWPDVPDNYRTRLDLVWPVYTSGRVDALERAARMEATAAADEVDVARADLRLEITRAYWALVTAGESERVVEQSIAQTAAHLRDVRNQLAQGLIPPNDVLTVEAQQSRQTLLTIQARLARTVAEAELARLIGAAPGTAIEPATPVEVGAPVAEPVDALVEVARHQRPERAALEKRVAAARERSVAAATGMKPTVAVAGGVDYMRPNPHIFPREATWKSSWDAGVNLNWPLFDGGRTRSEIAEAAAALKAAGERLADVDTSLAVEVRQRLAEVESSRAAVDTAGDAVRSAAEARRVVGERFDAGVATSTDVLDAQIVLLQAALERTQAIAAAHMADARLARALGR